MNRLWIATGLVTALILSAFVVMTTGAQEDTPTETPEDTTAAKDAEPGALADSFKEALAGNLGISVEELESALTQTQLDMIDQAVADGKLTEEEAANLREKIESGELRGLFPFIGRHHGPAFPRLHGLVVEAAADVLGLDKDDLVAELRDGNSMVDVAETQGVSEDDLKSGILANVQATLDQKVADGDITQEMADRVYENISDSIDRIVTMVPGDGPERGHRFGPGFGGEDLPLDDAADTETAVFY
jgi:polyhydroxyalkanoate synthesis regulator phasin